MSEINSNKVQNIFTEGIVIAVGTAYIYLVTFFYEFGYCDYFGIPTAFISPNLTTILVAAAAIITFLFSSVNLLGLSVPFLRAAIKPGDSSNPFKPFYKVNAFFLILGILIWRAYRLSWKGIIILCIVALGYNFFFFGIDLLLNWKKKTLRDRFEAITPPDTIVNVLIDKFGRGSIGLLVHLTIILFIAFMIGNGEALNQERFYVLKEQPNYIFLRTYGDMMITAPLDREKRLIGNSLLLIRLSSKDKIELNNEIVGPLKRTSDVNSTPKDKLKSGSTTTSR